MKDNDYELRRIPRDWFQKLVEEDLGDKEFIGDKENCGLVSNKLAKEDKNGVWVEFCNQNENTTSRWIHCIPHASVEHGVVLVKEDVFFSVCNRLKIETISDDTCKIHCRKITKELLPNLAGSVKVAPVFLAWDIAAEDLDQMLGVYFETPKFFYVDDIFTIPLSICPNLAKAASYYSLSDIHFKLISANCSSKGKDEISEGFYLLKNYSDLYCVSPLSSFLPPKSSTIFCSNKQTLSRVPPDLQKHVSELKTVMRSFLHPSRPDCPPMLLLTGASGSGKMLTTQLVTESLGVNLIVINSYDFSNFGVSAMESKLDAIFQSAQKRAPCVVAFKMLEIIGKDKLGMENATIVDTFLQKLTRCLTQSNKHHLPVIVVGVADCAIENISPGLTRAFVYFLKFQSVNPDVATDTVSWIAATKGFGIDGESLSNVGKKLSGYVHDDLQLLIKLAIRAAYGGKANRNTLKYRHLGKAIEIMEGAYSDSIGAAKVPNVRWDDVGGLSVLKDEIMLTLNTPLECPGLLAGGLRRSGILFYGPPGTGKTLMAKAVATECAMNFLSVKGPELMNMYVGQSERNVREVFSRGREAAPCILFFDELDSLAPNRGKNGDSGGATNRVVSQILAEMDGLQSNRGLFVIAATNRPDLVDPALLRPGRFDKMFYLGPCTDTESKLSVLKALTNKFVLSEDVDLKHVAELLPQQVTGADVYSVCSNAWLSAARRAIQKIEIGQGQIEKLTHVFAEKYPDLPLEVGYEDFSEGLAAMVPSLTPADMDYYTRMASSQK